MKNPLNYTKSLEKLGLSRSLAEGVVDTMNKITDEDYERKVRLLRDEVNKILDEKGYVTKVEFRE